MCRLRMELSRQVKLSRKIDEMFWLSEDRTLTESLQKLTECPFSESPDVCLSVATSEGKFNAPKILINVGDRMLQALLDTGASRSFLRQDLFPTTKGPPMRVRLGDGTHRWIEDVVTLPVSLSPLQVTHEFYVFPDLPEDCILGVDFMTLHDLWLRPSSGCVQIGDTGRSIPVVSEDLPEIKTSRRTSLPPRSSRLVYVKSDVTSSSCCLIESADNLDRAGILLQSSLHLGTPKAVLVANARDIEVILPKN